MTPKERQERHRKFRAWRRAFGPRIIELVASLVRPGSRIVDVAGGDGWLSTLLLDAGYRVTLIDPLYLREWRSPAVGIRERIVRPPGVRTLARSFHTTDAAKADLVVGFRPCSATPALARVRRRPVILVPCCDWYWWMRGRWMNRVYGLVPIGPHKRDIAFVSEG